MARDDGMKDEKSIRIGFRQYKRSNRDLVRGERNLKNILVIKKCLIN